MCILHAHGYDRDQGKCVCHVCTGQTGGSACCAPIIAPFIRRKTSASSYPLARRRHSRQQRDMESTPPQSPAMLGKTTALPQSPQEAELDYVPNPRQGELYLVRFAAPEFTSLCPVTDQPDFAHLVIDYAPGETIVE